MSFIAYATINGILICFAFPANLFFIYCLVCAATSGQIKQPLKILLETLVFCTVSNLVSIIGMSSCDLHGSDVFFSTVLYLLSICLFNTSMTSTVWLNFYYYTLIVPAKTSISVWIKKNIKIIIYAAWILDRIWTLNEISFIALRLTPLLTNSTTLQNKSELIHIRWVSFIIMCCLKTYLVLSMCVMIQSSVSICVYLCRHIQHMSASGRSYSSPKFHGQLRVSITGLLQCLLHVFCVLGTTSKFISEDVYNRSVNSFSHITAINIYMFATTLNLWMGQSVFRQKTVDLLQALKPRNPNKLGTTEQQGQNPELPTVQTLPEDDV